MDKRELIQVMLDGKTLNQINNRSHRIRFNGCFQRNHKKGEFKSCNINEILHCFSWEIYQEQKKKVNLYAYFSDSGCLYEFNSNTDRKDYGYKRAPEFDRLV